MNNCPIWNANIKETSVTLNIGMLRKMFENAKNEPLPSSCLFVVNYDIYKFMKQSGCIDNHGCIVWEAVKDVCRSKN